MVRAIDNKDRWIATIDLANAKLQPRHRLTDPAWINWSFNDFGWLADGRTLWYLSEESATAPVHTRWRQQGAATDGKWETSSCPRATAARSGSCATARSRATLPAACPRAAAPRAN